MSEQPRMCQNAFQIFSERYKKKLKRNEKLTEAEMQDFIITKWKFLPEE